jgi:hypothetical protein
MRLCHQACGDVSVEQHAERNVDYTVVLANDAAFTQNVVQSPPQTGTIWTSDPLAFGTWFWKVIGDDGVQNTEGTAGKVTYYLPSEDPNLVLWLKADEGIVLDASNNVQNWIDQSPAGLVFDQPNTTKRPSVISSSFWKSAIFVLCR